MRFTWTDGECDYSDSLTEAGISAGVFKNDSQFVADNSEDETTVIRFFAIDPLNQVSGKLAAATFFQELLDSTESLAGISDDHGLRTLADLMYLQNAILNGGFIDHAPDESKVLEIVSALPSGEHGQSLSKWKIWPPRHNQPSQQANQLAQLLKAQFNYPRVKNSIRGDFMAGLGWIVQECVGQEKGRSTSLH